MARLREYDQSQVLSAAMEAFRCGGFGGVSIKTLEVATGLKAGSIYNSFGDKEGLFKASFSHYVEVVLKARIAQYAPPEAGLAGVRRLFVSLLHEPGEGSLGCLITNSAIEFGGTSALPVPIGTALNILATALKERLSAAVPAWSTGSRIGPETASLKFLALYQGILVLIRAGWDKAALEAMLNAEFDRLEGYEHDT